MKKYIFLFSLLFLAAGTTAFGQSIKFKELVYLTGLNNNIVYHTLRGSDAFKQDYSENINGRDMEYFKNRPAAGIDTERIAVGAYTRLYNGDTLRTLDYTSTNRQYILNMISQAKHSGMNLLFRGADEINNIYQFDDSFYSVSITFPIDASKPLPGRVEIKQKEYLESD